jgi:hypothetical protein
MCRPWPEREGARRTLKLTVAVLGSLRGEEEMELHQVSQSVRHSAIQEEEEEEEG